MSFVIIVAQRGFCYESCVRCFVDRVDRHVIKVSFQVLHIQKEGGGSF